MRRAVVCFLACAVLILAGCEYIAPIVPPPDPPPDPPPVVENQPPVAVFSVNNTKPMLGEGVTCDGTYARDDDGVIVRWLWTFSGYGQQEGIIVVQTFSRLGWNPIRLTVIDDDGAAASEDYGVTVYDPDCGGPVCPCTGGS